MRAWLFLLSGLITWAAHFFAVYIAASMFPGAELARWTTLALTVAAAGLLLTLLWRWRRELRRSPEDDLGAWLRGLAMSGCALAAVGILYQGMPALIG